jgi:stage II sporulation protein D
MPALLLLVLAVAEPLEVRILKHEVPVTVRVEAQRLSCDDTPIDLHAVDVEASARQLKVGDLRCAQVLAEGNVTLQTTAGQRSYPGTVKVSLEGARLHLINVVDVEAYLPRVIAGEAVSPVLEAQAIVARTFALASRHRHAPQGYQLCDSTHCQLYRGDSEISPAAESAVQRTAHRVLLIGGMALKPAFSHPSCGSHTSLASDVFGNRAAGTAVKDEGPETPWQFEIERADLARALGTAPSGKAVEPLRRDGAGRIIEVRSFGVRLSGFEFLHRVQSALGAQSIRSAKFVSSESDTTIRFEGSGEGHGVGLCQYGARQMANQGADVQRILNRYFPESLIR